MIMMRTHSPLLSLTLASLLISLVQATTPGDCETKCGDEEGNPVLCQNFCARSSDLVKSL